MGQNAVRDKRAFARLPQRRLFIRKLPRPDVPTAMPENWIWQRERLLDPAASKEERTVCKRLWAGSSQQGGNLEFAIAGISVNDFSKKSANVFIAADIANKCSTG